MIFLKGGGGAWVVALKDPTYTVLTILAKYLFFFSFLFFFAC